MIMFCSNKVILMFRLCFFL